MNAVEFVKKHGWEKAAEAIKNAPPLDDKVWYFFWCNECGNGGSSQTMISNSYMPDYCACSVCTSEDLKSDDGDYEDLKRLVESYEFINKHGGIDRCKDWYRSSPFKRDKYMRELKQAIADVESVGGGV